LYYSNLLIVGCSDRSVCRRIYYYFSTLISCWL